jgi:alpha-1,2-mannosyltransferase
VSRSIAISHQSIDLIPNTELDNHYLKYHADKARRIEERGSKCCHTAPEAMDAAIELLEEL